MKVSDILDLYITNCPVTICELWSHTYHNYVCSAKVPKKFREKEVINIGGYAYDQRSVDGTPSSIGINIWVDTGHLRPQAH